MFDIPEFGSIDRMVHSFLRCLIWTICDYKAEKSDKIAEVFL